MDVAVSLIKCSPKQRSLPRHQYSIVAERFYRPEAGEYYTYGIQVITPDYTEVIHDISVCKKTADHIAELLNSHQVSAVHLYDVIMDMLP